MREMEWDKEECLHYPFSPFFEYLNSKFESFLKEKLKNTGITPTDFTYLINICLRSDMSQRELAKLFVVSEANVAKILKKLEKLDYIKRIPDEKNKSRKIVRLTDKGIDATSVLIQYADEWDSLLFDGIDDDKKEHFKDILFDITYNSSKF